LMHERVDLALQFFFVPVRHVPPFATTVGLSEWYLHLPRLTETT